MRTTRSLWLWLLAMLPITTSAQFYSDTLYYADSCQMVGQLCASGVENPGNAVDTNQSNYALMKTSLGLASKISLEVGFSVPANGGDFIGITLMENNQNLNVDLVGSINIILLDTSGAIVGQKTGLELQDVNLLSGTGNLYLATFFTGSGNYKIARVRIELTTLLGVANELRVYNAFYLSGNQFSVCGIDLADSVSAAGPSVPPGLLGGVQNPQFAVDTIPNNFALLSIPLGLLGGNAFLELQFSNPGNAGDYVGFTVAKNNTALSIGLLQNIRFDVIDTGGNIVATQNNVNVADLNLLFGDTNRISLGFFTPPGAYTFDKVRFTLNGLVLVLVDLKVFNAFKFNPVPNVLNITPSGNTTICLGDTLTLTADPGYGSYTWNTGDTTQSITVFSPGSYNVVGLDSNGCSAISAAITVEFGTQPTAPVVDVFGNTYLCNGDEITLTSSETEGIVWSNGATTATILVSTAGSYYVTFTDTSFQCPSYSDTIDVSVTPIIDSLSYPSVCPNILFTITADGGPGATYLWNTGATTPSIDVTITDSTVFSVMIADTAGCSLQVSEVIVPDPNGNMIAVADNASSFNGASITILPASNDIGAGTISSVNNPANGSVSVTANVVQYTPNATFTGTDIFDYIICNNICTSVCDTASITVNVSRLNVIQVVTPNGDGINDSFRIDGIEQFPDNQVYILNRWGDIIYEAQPYANDWDGTSNVGMSFGNLTVTSGTYYYVFVASPDAEPVKGFFEFRK